MHDRPERRDYARLELERRFLLEVLPDGVDPGAFLRLRDLFLAACGLRLRRVESPEGVEIVTKLGQKLPDPADPLAPGRARLTTIYLEPGMAEGLQSLPGVAATKRRYTVGHAAGGTNYTFAIDVWEQPDCAAGLILAEVECPTAEELAAVPLPPWASREVTRDPRYGAFRLAMEGPPMG